MAEKNDPLAGLPSPQQASSLLQNPQFLSEMAAAAGAHRDPAMFKWLEQAHNAAKEGAFEAVGHLMAGNPQEAVATWNRTGQYRDVVNVHDNGDGTWNVARKDGSSLKLDPVKEYKRFLNPQQFLAFQQGEEQRKALAEQRKLDEKYRQDTLAEHRRQTDLASADRQDAIAQRREAASANAMLRAGLAGGGGTRGTRSGSSSGGGGGGDAGDLKFNDASKVYGDIEKDIRARHDKAREADPTLPAVADQDIYKQATAEMARRTARFDRDNASGEYVIRGALPSGQYGVLARYDSLPTAAAAIQKLQLEGVLPEQGYVKSMGPQPIHKSSWKTPDVSHRQMENMAPLQPAYSQREMENVAPVPPGAGKEGKRRLSSDDRLTIWLMETFAPPAAAASGPEAFAAQVPPGQQFGAMGAPGYFSTRKLPPQGQ